jgi:hypothetical protein
MKRQPIKILYDTFYNLPVVVSLISTSNTIIYTNHCIFDFAFFDNVKPLLVDRKSFFEMERKIIYIYY